MGGRRGYPDVARYKRRAVDGPRLRGRAARRGLYPHRRKNYTRILSFGDSLSSGTTTWATKMPGGEAHGQPGSTSANWMKGNMYGTVMAQTVAALWGVDDTAYNGIWVGITVGTNDRSSFFNVPEATFQSNLQQVVNALTTIMFVPFPASQIILFGVYPYADETAWIAALNGCKFVSQRNLLEVDRDPVAHYDVTNTDIGVGSPADPPVGIHPNGSGQWLMIDEALAHMGETP